MEIWSDSDHSAKVESTTLSFIKIIRLRRLRLEYLITNTKKEGKKSFFSVEHETTVFQ